MDTPNNSAPAKSTFEVSGISRSGRVLKKSSKLLDFQSPDVVENKKPKRVGRPPRYSGRGRPSNAVRAQRILAAELDDFSNDGLELSVGGAVDNSFMDLDVDEALSHNSANSENPLIVAADSDVELDNLVADLVEGVEAESLMTGGMDSQNNGNDTRVRQSLYMIEKSNKRKMLKDGKVVTGKVERKDKGKSRFTAYSMWARELRKSGKLGKNQDLDFSSTARRLGELWANVSMKEKNAWRRKAKKLSSKERQKEKAGIEAESSNKFNPLSSPMRSSSSNSKSNSSNFLNRATTSRTRKLAAEKEQQAAAAAKKSEDKTSNSSTPTPRRKRRSSHRLSSGSFSMSNGHTPTTSRRLELKPSVTPTKAITNNIQSNSNSFKTSTVSLPPPNIDPIDAASHLKLLGESLSVIGEKLKEHDGEIALSGSLSVLLDSLLCSLGPLMCLTTHIPGLEKNKQLSSNLTSTLDNIAYVMPGL